MKFLPTVALLLGFSCGAYAQSPDSEMPAPTIESLSAEVEALKAKTSSWDKVLEHLPRISGHIQPGYEIGNTASTFFIKRLGLMFAGDIGAKVDYFAHVDFVNPKIIDVFVRYRPFDQLGAQIGQFLIPFGIENTEYTPLKYEFIDYSIALRRLMGFNDICGLSASGRDTGVQAFGGFWKRDGYSLLNYNICILNGQGLSVRDVNKSKDVTARFTFRPAAGLQISGSFYWGEYGENYVSRTRYCVGACYDRGSVVVRGEFTGGSTGRIDSEGVYAMAGWRAAKTLMPVVRYDTFLEDKSFAASRQTNYTAGLLWSPFRYLRCQANYTYENFASRAVSDRNVLVLMFTGMF